MLFAYDEQDGDALSAGLVKQFLESERGVSDLLYFDFSVREGVSEDGVEKKQYPVGVVRVAARAPKIFKGRGVGGDGADDALAVVSLVGSTQKLWCHECSKREQKPVELKVHGCTKSVCKWRPPQALPAPDAPVERAEGKEGEEGEEAKEGEEGEEDRAAGAAPAVAQAEPQVENLSVQNDDEKQEDSSKRCTVCEKPLGNENIACAHRFYDSLHSLELPANQIIFRHSPDPEPTRKRRKVVVPDSRRSGRTPKPNDLRKRFLEDGREEQE